ncbi:response regulator [Streptomyces sp. C10-9-1]|uniref:response regulator n=1 Tax=unclassified Streptomyces TaxID=2593676 RepID=UPI0021125B20|nr:response regulator [Streptomyces sp. C10-9-1]MCQ6555004.1 response regulator [Streptomyces sp. C10-9-1]
MVDDDRTNRMMLTYRLEINGIDCAAAENGQQALSMMRTDLFSVVLLDILMPGLDGYATLEIMKNDPALRDIPVIMISQLDEMDSVMRCLDLGAEDYLPKPLNSRLLMARLDGILLRNRLKQLEEDHQEQLDLLADSVTAAGKGLFDPASLKTVADRGDGFGELARTLISVAGKCF